jgi:hypothetical protein
MPAQEEPVAGLRCVTPAQAGPEGGEKSLGFGPRKIVSGGCWWTVAGEYRLTVTGNFTPDDESIPFSALPVTLKVSEPK